MKKFEYKIFEHSLINAKGAIERALNELGKEGWEICSAVQYDTNWGSKPNIVYTLRREVVE